MIRDIKPRSPVTRLRRDYGDEELATPIDANEAAAVIGINRSFMARALGHGAGWRPKTVSLSQVLELLDIDGYHETFVPRSHVPTYLLAARPALPTLVDLPADYQSPLLAVGDARDLLRGLPPRSVQCAVTSSPYWGMRVYDNVRDLLWADGEKCPYGFEQTPEGFIRHTVEMLHVLKPSMNHAGSVWWNLMDTYNTRTPIRQSSKAKLDAMGRHQDHALGWTEHEAVRHSAGHMFLTDGELASIPTRVAERASRIGYRLKSLVIWNKNTTPEPVRSRVSRQAEFVLHLSVGTVPHFDTGALRAVPPRLGGPDAASKTDRLTDVWSIPTAHGKNGHGAEFPIALPARCIALTSHPGDLVVDPFVGSGTSVLAAYEYQRRFVGFDISERYIEIARKRLKKRTQQTPLGLANDATNREAVEPTLDGIGAPSSNGVGGNEARPTRRRRTLT